MPTSAVHLNAALVVLRDTTLAARQHLSSGEQRAAFLLGSVSPDVRVVSGVSREETHFYDIPLDHHSSASQNMLENYPSLADPAALTPGQAAFVAGYITHLMMDEAWLEVVVMPYIFIDDAAWGSQHPNFRLYSLLMIHLAETGGQQMTEAIVHDLRAARPQAWLPFASDDHLRQWRDRVAEHMNAEHGWRTAEMFARYMQVDAHDLFGVVTSDQALATQVFSIVAQQTLDDFHQQTHQRTIEALNSYYSPKRL